MFVLIPASLASLMLAELLFRSFQPQILHWNPARVVSIHQPLRCIDYDGSAKSLAEEMAVASGLPVRKLGALPGSLGTLLGVDLGIPIVTVELPGAATSYSPQQLWDRNSTMMLVAIRVRGPGDGRSPAGRRGGVRLRRPVRPRIRTADPLHVS